MQLAARLVTLLLAVTVAACGKPKATTTPQDPPPTEPGPSGSPAPTEPAAKGTPSDADLEALFARSLDFFDELAGVVDTNKDNCKAMAAAMDGVFTRNKALLDEAKALEQDPEVDRKADAYMEAHQDRLQAMMGKMQGGLASCASDPDVEAAMKRFDEM